MLVYIIIVERTSGSRSRLVSLEKTEAPERQGGPLAAQNAQSVSRGYRNVSFPKRKQRLQSARGGLWQPKMPTVSAGVTVSLEKTEAPERLGGPLAAQNAQGVKRSYRNVSFP